jgi:hypothetical protein
MDWRWLWVRLRAALGQVEGNERTWAVESWNTGDLMLRTLTLLATGGLAGALAFAGAEMLLRRDVSGDTPSPELAAVLLICALLLAGTGVGVAAAMRWSRGLSLVVGVGSAAVGIGGLLLLLVATLTVAGAFPSTLLSPLNLSIAMLMAVAGLAGIGLLRLGSAPVRKAGSAGPWLTRSWHPVAAGIGIGVAAAWFWGAVVWPLIPYECCFI